MKNLVFILLFFFLAISNAQEIKTINGIQFHKMDVRYYRKAIYINNKIIKSKLYKDTYWLEGGGKDTNGDGKIEYFTKICLMKQNKDYV